MRLISTQAKNKMFNLIMKIIQIIQNNKLQPIPMVIINIISKA